MKKVYQLISSLSLSLLAIGAIAQTLNGGTAIPVHHGIPDPNSGKFLAQTHRPARSSAGPANGRISYVQGDITTQGYTPGTNYTYWIPRQAINDKYTVNDTGKTSSPADCRFYTLNSLTVAFDTLWDQFTGQYQPIALNSSVTLDTVWANLTGVNTSGHSDSLIVWIYRVDKNGFPTKIALDSQLYVLPHNFFPVNATMDSVYTANFPLRTPLVIPTNVHGGWHFCVSLDYRNSDKKDTLGVAYASPLAKCGTSNYPNTYTDMGVLSGSSTNYGGSPIINSWGDGFYWYNTMHWMGNPGQQLWEPDTAAGNFISRLSNKTYFFYGVSCAGDTSVFELQDVDISVSIIYNSGTGINELTQSDVSVSQNFPNPFNKQTQITYNLAKSSDVVFSVYDLTGRELVNTTYSTQTPGEHIITLNANQFSLGIYFYSFNVNGSKVTQKMIITQ